MNIDCGGMKLETSQKWRESNSTQMGDTFKNSIKYKVWNLIPNP